MNLRRTVVLASGALTAVLAAVAGAWACTSLATLVLSRASGPAGAHVTVTGTGYAVVTPALPVVVRWNGTDGTELARVIPDAAGNISATVTVPARSQPGYYVVVAVQRDDRGVDRYGTPSRANFQLLGTSPAAATLAAAARPVSHSSDSLPAPAVAIAVVLLLATAAGVGRQAFGR